MPQLADPLPLATTSILKNRLALAPLTNQQSNEDGTASEEDLYWFEQLAARIRTADHRSRSCPAGRLRWHRAPRSIRLHPDGLPLASHQPAHRSLRR